MIAWPELQMLDASFHDRGDVITSVNGQDWQEEGSRPEAARVFPL